MPELDDQETDKLFQIGAERHDYAYDPDAWAQMEEMLEADDRRSVIAYWIGGALVLIALIALAFFYYSAGSSQVNERENADSEVSIQATPGVQVGNDTDAEPPTLKQETIDSGTQKSAIPPSSSPKKSGKLTTMETGARGGTRVTAAPAAKEETPLDARPYEKRSGAIFTKTDNEPGNTAVEKGAENHLRSTEQSEEISFPAVETNSKQGLTQDASPEATGKDVANDRIELLPRFSMLRQVLSMDNGAFIAERASALSDKASNLNGSATSEWKPEVKNSLAVGIAGGVIFSQSGSDPFAMARLRLGLDAEYRIGKKFALGTGAYFNQLCYRTSSDNYNVKNEFWVDGVKAETVEGQCNVLEIPLSAKYYFSGSRSNTFYVSTGAITYLMLREKYMYSYGNDAPVNARQGWRERNTNQHFFGMAHFNFGFQKTLGNQSALKLETYVHLPLTGIGHGQVRLFSTGVTAKYIFDFRR